MFSLNISKPFRRATQRRMRRDQRLRSWQATCIIITAQSHYLGRPRRVNDVPAGRLSFCACDRFYEWKQRRRYWPHCGCVVAISRVTLAVDYFRARVSIFCIFYSAWSYACRVVVGWPAVERRARRPKVKSTCLSHVVCRIFCSFCKCFFLFAYRFLLTSSYIHMFYAILFCVIHNFLLFYHFFTLHCAVILT